ncbi:hypothetical protein P879_07913, partial [Paragonimus westermani]
CLVLYVTCRINDRLDAELACPSHRCELHGSLTDDEIKALVPSSIYEKYADHHKQREVLTDSTLTFCPVVGCGAICDIPVATHNRFASDNSPNTVSAQTTRRNGILHRFWSRYRWFTRHNPSLARQTLHSQVLLSNSAPKSNADVFPSHSFGTPNNLMIKPLVACPSVGVTCPACQYTFCARCHIAWHPNQPFLCQSGLDHKARRRLNTYGVIRESRATKLQDQSNPIQSHRPSDLETFEQASGQPLSEGGSSSLHKLSKLRKYNRFRRLKSRMTLSPAHVTSSSSTVVDTSALAVGFPPYPTEAWLKRCPACFIPIERIEGCAQMMCRSCKHTFCWYCLKSLDVRCSFLAIESFSS